MNSLILQKPRINRYAFFIYLLFAFMLSTIVQVLLPVSLNRILAVMIVMVLGAYSYFGKELNPRDIFLFLYYGFVLVSTLLISQDKLTNFTDAVYFVAALLLLNFLQDAKTMPALRQTVDNLQTVIEIIVVISEFILLVELFSPDCYRTAWGGDKYFLGFTVEQHTLASSCCLLLSLVLAGTKGKSLRIWQLFLILIPTVCILASGARTFLVPLLICCYFYVKSHVKNRIAVFFVFGAVFAFFIYFFFHSNVYDKIQYTLSYNQQDFWASVTSGRTNFWMVDLRNFASGNPMQMLFGKGFDYIYRLNAAETGMAIWAHNDLINLLIGAGLTGTAVYCIVLVRFIRFFIKKFSTGLERFLFASYILFPMLVNGLYTYPHYLYSVVFLVSATCVAENLPEISDKPMQASEYFKGAV